MKISFEVVIFSTTVRVVKASLANLRKLWQIGHIDL